MADAETQLLHRRARLALPPSVSPEERNHYDRIERDVWNVQFHMRAALEEHVLDMDALSFAEAAQVIVDRLATATQSPP